MTITPTSEGFVIDNTLVGLLVDSTDRSIKWEPAESRDDIPSASMTLDVSDEHFVTCKIFDASPIIQFEVEVTLCSQSGQFDPDRSYELNRVLINLMDQGPSLPRYIFGGCDESTATFYFTYPWFFTETMRSWVPDEELINFCNEYVTNVCAPYPAIVPLLALYLRGTMKEENDLASQITETLDFLRQVSSGTA